ncbi:MAG TPA: D-alanyl-D-alanine carboxypeptidase/D-alanyl-D-alanine-endopeptidase [Gemmatimonadetes bacterium]|nr:D-alanyl-D-alanine carboxypeptidase/D-alanyl-D-alanine-endopeptidase [Gemmatimonadota bacterium]
MKNFPTKVAAILCACVVTLPMFRVSIASTIDWGESRFCCSKEPREISLSETDPRIMQLNDQISKLILPRVERSEDWGALVVSLEHGDTLFSYSKDRTLSPASNMKLFTTAAALHFLGSKFRYQTFLYYDGPIQNGHLQGDLILYGTGDPGISERFSENKALMYESFLLSLEQSGVKVIDGDIIGDGTYFSGPEIGPEWNTKDLNDWFAAPVSALSLDENIVTLQILPGLTIGDPPKIHSDHENFPLAIYNTARTVSGRPTAPLWLDRETPNSEIHIYGQIRSGSPGVWRRLTVPDPELLAASELKQVLLSNGVEVQGEPKSISDNILSRVNKDTYRDSIGNFVEPPQLMGRHISPEIIEYLKVLNHESHNLIAETLLKTIGKLTGEAGSFEGGAKTIRKFLEEEVGIHQRDVKISDGSGLSPSNEASPKAFIQLLTYIAKTGQWTTFLSTLPEAGQSLRRMYRTPETRNLKAKTGTIEGVSALTGVVKTRDKEELLFSIISNEVRSTRTSKRIEDLVGAQLASFQRTPKVN